MSEGMEMNAELSMLGENIRIRRRNLRISQEKLAESCGLHRTYVCDIERGARNVSFGSLLKLAHGLGTTVSELTQHVESGPVAAAPVSLTLCQYGALRG